MPFIDNHGVKIHYKVIGQGPPLVLYHGLSDSLQGWNEYGYVEQLQPHFQLILLDGRGHGRSDKPHQPEAYTLDVCVQDVLSVLDTLNLTKAHFFGCSMGGWIGFGLAKMAPERLLSLSLNGAHPFAESMEPFRLIFQSGLEAWTGRLIQAIGSDVASNLSRLLENDLQALQAVIAFDRPDLSLNLAALTMPCLLMVGEDDLRVTAVKKAANLMPQGQFVQIAGQNHFSAIINSRQVVPHLLTFLQSAPFR